VSTPGSVAGQAGEADAAALAAADAFLESRRDEIVAFAAELIAAPSANPPGDESRVAALVAERLRLLGATDVQVVRAAPLRDNVIGTFVGNRDGRVLMLSGHLDTKPPGDVAAWDTPPVAPTLQDGMLVGLGSADMKGAVAAMTYAAGAAAAAGIPGSVTVVFTADEEAGGAFGSKWLAEHGHLRGDACVIAEPSGVRSEWEAIRLVSRGVAIFRISVRGTEMHSSLSDELGGINANLKTADLMMRMSDAASAILHYVPHALTDSGPTFNVSLSMKGGVGYGVLPGHAEFLCDVRALPGMTAAEIEADVRMFIAKAEEDDPDLHTEFEMVNWTPPSEIDRSHAVVRALQQAAADVLGESPPLGVFPGGTDAPYFSDLAGIPTVPSFGPGLLTNAHAPNEAVPAASIVCAAKIYALAAVRFLSA
jgi:acetylornithine deacetylase